MAFLPPLPPSAIGMTAEAFNVLLLLPSFSFPSSSSNGASNSFAAAFGINAASSNDGLTSGAFEAVVVLREDEEVPGVELDVCGDWRRCVVAVIVFVVICCMIRAVSIIGIIGEWGGVPPPPTKLSDP